MIKIPINVAHVSGGTGPFTFVFTSTNTNVSFSNPSGTVPLISGTYIASTDVIYATQNDIGVGIVSVTFTDTSTGCVSVLSPLTIVNPCTMQSTITNNGEFVFVATTNGGSGSYTYEWNYDSNLFEPNDLDLTDNTLSLKLKKVAFPPLSSTISVLITDGNGCNLFKNYLYNFCYPVITRATVPLVCTAESVRGCTLTVASATFNYDLKPLVNVCANQVIDWTKLTFNVPTQFCVNHLGNGIINIASSSVNGISGIINYTVVTTSGLQSTGQLIVNAPICTLRPQFAGTPTTIQLKAGDVIGTDKLINVESRVSGTPNWSTFTFTNTPSWGTVTLNGNRDIVYDITNIATTPTVPDVIKWSLQDYSGNQINITDTVLRDILPLPVTNADVICNSCGETTAPQDLLANDTGAIDRSTVQIVLNDPDIVISKDANNNFIFTSLPGASFGNLNSYKVANIQGAFSPNQNFLVQVACVGSVSNPTLDLTCVPSKVFNIRNQFVSPNSFGDVFVETTPALPTYASQGGVITVGGDVDLTGKTNKVYTFQYTAQNVVACSPTWDDTGILTVNHATTPNINLSAATLVSAGVYSFTFTYSGIASNFVVTDDGSAAVFHTGIVANAGSGSFILYAASGSSIVISATTQCGNITTDTTVI